MRRNIVGSLDVEDLIMGIIGLALTGTGSIAMFAQYRHATPVQFIVVLALHALLISAFIIVGHNMVKLAMSSKK